MKTGISARGAWGTHQLTYPISLIASFLAIQFTLMTQDQTQPAR